MGLTGNNQKDWIQLCKAEKIILLFIFHGMMQQHMQTGRANVYLQKRNGNLLPEVIWNNKFIHGEMNLTLMESIAVIFGKGLFQHIMLLKMDLWAQHRLNTILLMDLVYIKLQEMFGNGVQIGLLQIHPFLIQQIQVGLRQEPVASCEGDLIYVMNHIVIDIE